MADRMKQVKMKHIRITLCAILVFVLCLFSVPVYAAGDGTGGGNHDGTGGGSDTPVSMTGSSISNGQTGVSTDVTITLHFSHNVTDGSVQANNASAISMSDSSGGPVHIYVSFGSGDQRRDIYVRPSSLQEGTTYTLTVSAGVMAKNGRATGSASSITFTTKVSSSSGGSSSSSGSSGSESSGSSGSSGSGSSGSSSSSGSGSSSSSSSSSGGNHTGTANSNTTSSSSATGSLEEQNTTTSEETTGEASSEETYTEIEGAPAESSIIGDDEVIEKVSDKKPGRVEETQEETETENETVVYVVIGCIALAAVITGSVLYKKKKTKSVES